MGDRPLPANVRYIEFSREAFTALVNQKIGIFPRQWRNYKICDFKPAFGHLLEEYFNGFHFWGYCDIDLLFENILQFLTSSVLANHDRIFAGGHFSLMKNSPRLCLLYQEGSGEFEFRHVFSTGKYLGFDEWNGFYKICVKAGVRQYFDDYIADIDPDSFRLKLTGNIKTNPIKHSFGSAEGSSDFIVLTVKHTRMNSSTFICRNEDFANLTVSWGRRF